MQHDTNSEMPSAPLWLYLFMLLYIHHLSLILCGSWKVWKWKAHTAAEPSRKKKKKKLSFFTKQTEDSAEQSHRLAQSTFTACEYRVEEVRNSREPSTTTLMWCTRCTTTTLSAAVSHFLNLRCTSAESVGKNDIKDQSVKQECSTAEALKALKQELRLPGENSNWILHSKWLDKNLINFVLHLPIWVAGKIP